MKKALLDFIWLSGGGVSFDNSENTTIDGKQLWGFIGDSFISGQPAADNVDTGMAPYYPGEYFNTSTLSITSLTGDLPTASNGSMCPKMVNDYYRLTGYKMIPVNTAVGGADFYPNGDDNNYYTTGDNYANFVSKQNSAKGALGVDKLRGIIMHLGINDARSAISNEDIQVGVTSLFSRLITDFPGVPIYVINIGLDQNKAATQKILDVRAMIEAEAVLNPDRVKIVMRLEDYISAPYFYMSDEADVHPSMFGLELIAGVVVKNIVDNGWARNQPISYNYSATVLDVFNRLGTVSTPERRCISDFIEWCITNSNWNNIDTLYLTTISNTTARRQCFKRNGGQVTGGTTETQCLSTDGTITGHLMSDFIPSVNGVGYTLNDAFWGVYCLEDTIKDISVGHIMTGVVGATSTHQMRIGVSTTSGGQGQYSINNSGVATVVDYNLKGNMFHAVSRSASNSLSYRRNANTNSGTTASTGVPTTEIAIGAWNNNGAIQSPFAGKFGLIVGGGRPTDGLTFYKRVRELVIDMLVLQDPNTI